MRIGMIAPPWLAVPPRRYGGIEAMIGVLAEALAAAGHEVILAASSDSTCAVTRLPGFAPSDPRQLGATVPELRHTVLAYRAMAAAGVDVVHDHTMIGPHLASRPSSLPVITTMHGAFEPVVADSFRALPGDVGVVAISGHQASTVSGVPIRRVIHHGVDAARIPFGAGAGGYACFLGRMNPVKGVRTAIDVAQRAGVPLRIAAKMNEPAERDYFAAEIEPLLGNSVEFLGELDATEKFELLGGSVALVNPIAWDEPFGMVMIESLAAGTPVITTFRGSAPEIVVDGVTGYLRESVEQLAVALSEVGSLDRRDCRAATEGHFSAARMAADYLEVFERATSRDSALSAEND